MGLFGGKKTYVASTVYNMAGPESKRIQFLKTTLIGGMIGNNKFSFGDMIRDTYLPGPGIQARSFFRWCLANYGEIGVPTGFQGGVLNISSDDVVPFLPVETGQTAQIVSVNAGPTDYSYWAEQWMLENHPELMDSGWVSDVNDTTTEITITFADSTTQSFTPTDMVNNSKYIYVVYTPKDELGTVFDSVYWFYRVGSGNAVLDAAVTAPGGGGEWLPAIPFRVHNDFLSTTQQPAAYTLAKRAYRKATNRKKYQDMIDKIADNENLKDIDHAYMMYGVCLNVKERACREYIFRLFKKFAGSQVYNSSDYNTYSGEVIAHDPATGNVPVAPLNHVRIKSEGPLLDTDLDFEMQWSYIRRLTGNGLVRPGVHKKGDYWIEKGGATSTTPAGSINAAGAALNFFGSSGSSQKITMYRQTSDSRWEAIEVMGLKHLNHIYKSKSVEIDAWEALDDLDDTGFLIPLHYATLKEMSLIKSTQMMTAATFMVFNSEKTVKQKWYQTLAFKIFIFIVIIALVVIFPPAGGAAGAAVSAGTAVAAAIGVTGTLALIVAAVVNALVAMIISKIIGMVAVKLFGEKWGAIIGAVVSMLVMNFGSGLMQGQSMATMWGSMMNPVNILNMTNAVGTGITGYMQASVQQTMIKQQDMLKDYQKQSQEITDKIAEMYGGARGTIDPLNFTQIGVTNFYESEATFLARTLMTGTDIASMTNDMVTNFADYALALPEPN